MGRLYGFDPDAVQEWIANHIGSKYATTTREVTEGSQREHRGADKNVQEKGKDRERPTPKPAPRKEGSRSSSIQHSAKIPLSPDQQNRYTGGDVVFILGYENRGPHEVVKINKTAEAITSLDLRNLTTGQIYPIPFDRVSVPDVRTSQVKLTEDQKKSYTGGLIVRQVAFMRKGEKETIGPPVPSERRASLFGSRWVKSPPTAEMKYLLPKKQGHLLEVVGVDRMDYRVKDLDAGDGNIFLIPKNEETPININETRTYVQAVWSNCEAYARLYPR